MNFKLIGTLLWSAPVVSMTLTLGEITGVRAMSEH